MLYLIVMLLSLPFLYADLRRRTTSVRNSILKFALLNLGLAAAVALASILSTPSITVARTLHLAVRKQEQNITNGSGPVANQIPPVKGLGGDELDLGKPDAGKPHTPVLHLKIHPESPSKPDANGRIYVRLAAYDTYSGSRWTAGSSLKLLTVDGEDGTEDGKVLLRRSVKDPARYTVILPGSSSDVLPLLPGVSEVELTAVTRNACDTIYSPVEIAGLPWVTYLAASDDIRWLDIPPGRMVPGRAPASCYRLEPGSLTDRLKTVVKNNSRPGAGSAAFVDNLMTYLRTNCSYSSASTKSQAKDPVETFLFNTKKGHCELFASSMTLMLRAGGIPARICVGYCGGEYDQKLELYTFYRDDAHAWTEVFVEKYGWVLIDATPPSGAAARTGNAPVPVGHNLDLSASVNLSEAVKKRFSGKLTLGQGGPGNAGRNAAGTLLPGTVLNAVILTVIACVVFLCFWISSRKGLSRKSSSGRKLEIPDSFRLFCRHFASLGCPIRKGQTAAEYLALLKRRGLVGNECDELVAHFHATSYGRQTPSRSADKLHCRTIRALQRRKTAQTMTSDHRR